MTNLANQVKNDSSIPMALAFHIPLEDGGFCNSHEYLGL